MNPLRSIIAAIFTLSFAHTASGADANWEGFYVGGIAGATWSKSDSTTLVGNGFAGYFLPNWDTAVNSKGNQRIDPLGFSGGVDLGYNKQFNRIVLGFEVDLNAQSLKGEDSKSGPYPGAASGSTFRIESTVKSDWLATARGRIGFAADNVLYFATGNVPGCVEIRSAGVSV